LIVSLARYPARLYSGGLTMPMPVTRTLTTSRNRLLPSTRAIPTATCLLVSPATYLRDPADSADECGEGRTGCGTETDTAKGDLQARDPQDTCLPIRSRPHLDELRDDAGAGRRAISGHCRRDREDYQAPQLTSQILVDWSQHDQGGSWSLIVIPESTAYPTQHESTPGGPAAPAGPQRVFCGGLARRR
jgi:hypothetical protein